MKLQFRFLLFSLSTLSPFFFEFERFCCFICADEKNLLVSIGSKIVFYFRFNPICSICILLDYNTLQFYLSLFFGHPFFHFPSSYFSYHLLSLPLFPLLLIWRVPLFFVLVLRRFLLFYWIYLLLPFLSSVRNGSLSRYLSILAFTPFTHIAFLALLALFIPYSLPLLLLFVFLGLLAPLLLV